MRNEVVWKVGGQQGEGIDSTGQIFALALARKGYFISSNKHFASRIKGGYTHYQIHVSTEPTYYHGDYTDVLLALDQETIDNNLEVMSKGSIILRDGKEESLESDGKITTLFLPLTEIAESIGGKIVRNMVALGASSALFGLSEDLFDSLIEDKFKKKGEEIVNMNKNAVRAGFDKAKEYLNAGKLAAIQLEKPELEVPRNLMIGNEAVGFGALAAGCRFLSAYPITPASEVMEWLKKELPRVGGTVVQAEDEIAGITMAIGAAYSGVRAMTSTSGPGFSLKTEALGLAGISETPLVIMNTQRGGPGTGLPTKYEQADVNTMINAGHGEIPRIVLAPSTVEEAFYMTAQAFNYAEQYQCPVIIAMDLYLSLFNQTVNKLDFSKININRGKLLFDEEAAKNDERYFLRYEFTQDGISSRTIPGQKGGVHTANSNEHNQTGHIDEDPTNRTNMMKKRLGKLASLIDPGFEATGNKEADVLLVGFGSTYGVIQEAKKSLEKRGINVTHVHVKRLTPFDLSLKDYVLGAKTVIVIENNYTGQLKRLMQMELNTGKELKSITKYDGNPFTLREVMEQIDNILAEEVR
ncbi:2-oxoacid:acceptor oxidoreductase subunit alpha [Tepidibacillus fermentans]|uniref:2-oxoglutarate ferredoxin oxidoreductase subunit alpha n=1 Tax=Tepidibacillus fermentans TaxID=1281767 RepID=A0A4R3KI81_9BACI|nr:2-oxoacid:acceptor oxidoreductase subunit alpha [Tepidibacillus fermentans]TCS83205.1 2-oxoglutarate ferredoxin oxidoreductase subunit alpha [Tepidibacillus fermentans]